MKSPSEIRTTSSKFETEYFLNYLFAGVAQLVEHDRISILNNLQRTNRATA